MKPSTDPRSLFDVWNLYQLEIQKEEEKQKASITLALVKTAIIRYTLPGWGLEPSSHRRVTAWENYQGLTFMKGVELPQLVHGLETQQKVFEQQEVPLDIQRNYRAALNRFLEWCYEQSWWNHSRPQSSVTKRDPRPSDQKVRHQRPKYALGTVEGDFVSENLQSELEAFQNFRLNQNGVRQSTVNKDLRQIRLVLGWLHRFKGISLGSLKLQDMISWADIDSSDRAHLKQAEDLAFKNLELINEYIAWLENSGDEKAGKAGSAKSLYTSIDVLRIFLVVAQFIYRERSQSVSINRHQDVPIVQLLRQQLAEAQAMVKEQRSSQPPPKNLDWTDFLALVETMRQQGSFDVIHLFPASRSDTNPSPNRALVALAHVYQCFLLSAFLCYLPPQRQQIWRNLQFLVGSRPDSSEIYANQNSEISGYIYKENEQWWLYLLRDDYKTSKAYQDLLIKVPNIQYPHDRCFYQYLDEWLFELEFATRKGVERINGLRQVFSPQHEYFFTQRNGKRFVHASNFNKLLQSSALDILGEPLTPELLRSMFAKYIFSQDVDAKIASLAALMAKTSKKNGEIYDLWLDSESIKVGVQIAEKVAQDFVWRSNPQLRTSLESEQLNDSGI